MVVSIMAKFHIRFIAPLVHALDFLKPSSLFFPFRFGKKNGVFKLTLSLVCPMILHNSAHENTSLILNIVGGIECVECGK